MNYIGCVLESLYYKDNKLIHKDEVLSSEDGVDDIEEFIIDVLDSFYIKEFHDTFKYDDFKNIAKKILDLNEVELILVKDYKIKFKLYCYKREEL